MKKGMSEKDFVEYIENRGYKFSEDLTKKDKKGTDWYRKVLPLPNGAELIMNIRVWKVLDVYTYIEDKKREIKTDVEGFAFNIKEGFSRTGFNISLWMAVAMTTQDYRNKSGDVDFKINRDDLGIEVFN